MEKRLIDMTAGTTPLLILVVAPSGAGKSTICDRLIDECANIVYSISCTTRQPRGEETDGVDYYFLAEADFDANVADDAFLENAVVHGFRYGTLRRTVAEGLRAGNDVLMDIDVQGAKQIRETIGALSDEDPIRKGFLDIFIVPPSLEELEKRLTGRGEDDSETIGLRLINAEAEMACAGEFAHVIVNDVLDKCYASVRRVIEDKRV